MIPKNIFFSIIFLFFTFFLFSQTDSGWQWAKRGGGPGDFGASPLFPYGYERIVDLAIDADNNYYFLAEIGGAQYSALVDYDGQPLHTYNNSDNKRDIYVFSTDSDGNFRWHKMIGAKSNDQANSINTDAQNNIYVSGTIIPPYSLPDSSQDSTYFDTDTIIPAHPDPLEINSNGKGAFLIKYNNDGDFQWLRQPEGEHPVLVLGDIYNYMIFARMLKTVVEPNGRSHSLIIFPEGEHLNGQLSVEEGNEQTAIVNYDTDGVLEGFFTIDMKPLNDNAYNYQLAYDTNLDRYYIADTKRKSTDTVSINGYGANTGPDENAFYLAAVDNQGEVLWYHRNNHLNDSYNLGDLQLDDAGNIYLSGRMYSKPDFNDSFAGYEFAMNNNVGSGRKSPYLIKLTPDGDLLWGTNPESYSPWNGESIAIDSSSVYLAMPSLRNQWGGTAIPGPYGQGHVPAPIIMKFNAATGETQEVISTPEIPSGVNGFTVIGLDRNGDLIGGGYFSNNLFYDESFAIFNSGGPSDFFIAKYKPQETSCIPPKTIHTARINDTDVKIYWSPRQGETQWEVAYSNEPYIWPGAPEPNINPETQGTYVEVDDTPELILADVSTANESKHYQVFVRPICEEGSGSWSAPAYFVLEDLSEEDCLAPQFLQLENIDENSAEVSWTPVGNETQWKVSYDMIYQGAQEEVQSVLVNGNPEVTLENLLPETEYVVFVEAVCTAEDHSEKEGPLSLTTEKDLSIEENAFKDLKVYPNPTSGVIHISSESDIEAYTLYNLQGKIIQEGRTTTTIDLSELSSGIYILNLQNKEGHKKQMKVVKK